MKRNWTANELQIFEDLVKQRFLDGKIKCPIHLSGGNEEELIAIFEGINDDDYVMSTHRSHYHYLLKGGSSQSLMDELEGLESGCCKGKGRSMHVYNPTINFYSSAIVGGICPIAVGVALGIKKSYKLKAGERPHVWCFIGDGAEDQGSFIEAVRFGASRQLPITFVIEDNDLAVESTKADRWHNFIPIKGRNVIRYNYIRKYPHVGIGKHVSF